MAPASPGVCIRWSSVRSTTRKSTCPTSVMTLWKRYDAIPEATVECEQFHHFRHENIEKFEVILMPTGSWIRSRRIEFELPVGVDIILNFSWRKWRGWPIFTICYSTIVLILWSFKFLIFYDYKMFLQVIKAVIPENLRDDQTVYHINPCGTFIVGGPKVCKHTLSSSLLLWDTFSFLCCGLHWVVSPWRCGTILA